MTSHKVRIVVVTREDGTLVGTGPAPKESTGPGIRARLVAGPGQRLEEIELELDEALLASNDAAALHVRIREHMAGSRKTARGRSR